MAATYGSAGEAVKVDGTCVMSSVMKHEDDFEFRGCALHLGSRPTGTGMIEPALGIDGGG